MLQSVRSGKALRRSILGASVAAVFAGAAGGPVARAADDGIKVETVCFTVYNGTDRFASQIYGLRYSNGQATSKTPAIVLVHGVASSTGNWDFTPNWSVARKLTKQGYVVISYDRLGYGGRSRYQGDPTTLYTYNQRDHLHQLVMQVRHGTYMVPASDDCGPQVPKTQSTLASPKAVIVGHSQGGSVVQGYPGTYHDVSAMIQADIGGPMIEAPANPIPAEIPAPPTGFPADPNVPPAPPGYFQFFNNRQACEAFNVDWRGALQDVVDIACDPKGFIFSPTTVTPPGLPTAADLIGQTGPIPVLLTWGDKDNIAPIYNDELHYRYWLQNCRCDVSRLYLPQAGHLFMVHRSLDLWINWVTTWLSERGLEPTPGAPAPAPIPTSLAAAGPTAGTTPAAPREAGALAPAAASAPIAGNAAKCVVPRLKGLTVAAATSKLAKANCEVGRIRTRVSMNARPNRVMRQSHTVSARLRAGSKVNLVVAKKGRAKRSQS